LYSLDEEEKAEELICGPSIDLPVESACSSEQNDEEMEVEGKHVSCYRVTWACADRFVVVCSSTHR